MLFIRLIDTERDSFVDRCITALEFDQCTAQEIADRHVVASIEALKIERQQTLSTKDPQ